MVLSLSAISVIFISSLGTALLVAILRFYGAIILGYLLTKCLYVASKLVLRASRVSCKAYIREVSVTRGEFSSVTVKIKEKRTKATLVTLSLSSIGVSWANLIKHGKIDLALSDCRVLIEEELVAFLGNQKRTKSNFNKDKQKHRALKPHLGVLKMFDIHFVMDYINVSMTSNQKKLELEIREFKVDTIYKDKFLKLNASFTSITFGLQTGDISVGRVKLLDSEFMVEVIEEKLLKKEFYDKFYCPCLTMSDDASKKHWFLWIEDIVFDINQISVTSSPDFFKTYYTYLSDIKNMILNSKSRNKLVGSVSRKRTVRFQEHIEERTYSKEKEVEVVDLGDGIECPFCSFYNEGHSSTCQLCKAVLPDEEDLVEDVPRKKLETMDDISANKVLKEQGNTENLDISMLIGWVMLPKTARFRISNIDWTLKERIPGYTESVQASIQSRIEISAKKHSTKSDYMNWTQVPEEGRVDFSPKDIDFAWSAFAVDVNLPRVSVNLNNRVSDMGGETMFKVGIGQTICQIGAEVSLFGLEWEQNLFEEACHIFCKRVDVFCAPISEEEASSKQDIEIPQNSWICSNCKFLNAVENVKCSLCDRPYTSLVIETCFSVADTSQIDSVDHHLEIEVPLRHKHGVNFHIQLDISSIELYFIDEFLFNVSRATTFFPSESSDGGSSFSGVLSTFTIDSGALSTTSTSYSGEKAKKSIKSMYRRKKSRKWVTQILDRSIVRTFAAGMTVTFLTIGIESDLEKCFQGIEKLGVTNLQPFVLSLNCSNLALRCISQLRVPPAVSFENRTSIKANKNLRQQIICCSSAEFSSFKIQVDISPKLNTDFVSILECGKCAVTMHSRIYQRGVQYDTSRVFFELGDEVKFLLSANEWISVLLLITNIFSSFQIRKKSESNSKKKQERTSRVLTAPELHPYDIYNVAKNLLLSKKCMFGFQSKGVNIQILGPQEHVNIRAEDFSLVCIQARPNVFAVSKSLGLLTFAKVQVKFNSTETLAEIGTIKVKAHRATLTVSAIALKIWFYQGGLFGSYLYDILQQQKLCKLILKRLVPPRPVQAQKKANWTNYKLRVFFQNVALLLTKPSNSESLDAKAKSLDIGSILAIDVRFELIFVNQDKREKLLKLHKFRQSVSNHNEKQLVDHGYSIINCLELKRASCTKITLKFSGIIQNILEIEGLSISNTSIYLSQLNATFCSSYFGAGELVTSSNNTGIIVHEVKKNSCPMKISLNLNVKATFIRNMFCFSLLKRYETLGLVFQSIIPKNRLKEPTRADWRLGWWDNLRYMFQGKYCFASDTVWFFFLSRNEHQPLDGVWYEFEDVTFANKGYEQKSATDEYHSLLSRWTLLSGECMISVLASGITEKATKYVVIKASSSTTEVQLNWLIPLDINHNAVFEPQVQLFHKQRYEKVEDWFIFFRPRKLDLFLSCEFVGLTDNYCTISWCVSIQSLILRAFHGHMAPPSPEGAKTTGKHSLGKLFRTVEVVVRAKNILGVVWPSKHDFHCLKLKANSLTFSLKQSLVDTGWTKENQSLSLENLVVYIASRSPKTEMNTYVLFSSSIGNIKLSRGISVVDGFSSRFDICSLFPNELELDWFSLKTGEDNHILSTDSLTIIFPVDKDARLDINAAVLYAKYNLAIRDLLISLFFTLRKVTRKVALQKKRNKSTSSINTPWNLNVEYGQFRLEADRDIVAIEIPTVQVNSFSKHDMSNINNTKLTEKLSFEASKSHLFVFDPDSSVIDKTVLSGWITSTKDDVHWNKIVSDFKFKFNHTRVEFMAIDGNLGVNTSISFDIPSIVLDLESSDFFAVTEVIRNLLLVPPPKENVEELEFIDGRRSNVSRRSSVDGTRSRIASKSRQRTVSDVTVRVDTSKDSVNDEIQKKIIDLMDELSDYNKVFRTIARDLMLSESSTEISNLHTRTIKYNLTSCILNFLDNTKKMGGNSRNLEKKLKVYVDSFAGEHNFDAQDGHKYVISLHDFKVTDAGDAEVFGAHLNSNQSRKNLVLLSIDAEMLPKLSHENIQLNLYKKWKLSIFQGSAYKFQLSVNSGLSDFLGEYFRDDGFEDDILFSAIEASYENMMKEQAGNSGNIKGRKWPKLAPNLSPIKNLMHRGDATKYEIVMSGWILITKKQQEASNKLLNVFSKRTSYLYWCDLKCSNSQLIFVFYYSEKRIKQSKKTFTVDDIISIGWKLDENNKLTHTLEFQTISYQCSIGRRLVTETKYVNLKWAASVLPGTREQITAKNMISEIFADPFLALHYEVVRRALGDTIEMVEEKLDNEMVKKETMLFFNHIRMSQIRLRLFVEGVSVGKGIRFDMSGTYTLNISEFHLHSQLMSWRKLYKIYRYHALKGIIRSLILPRRRDRTALNIEGDSN